MRTGTALSLNQAAKAAKKSKASILDALKYGKLSGSQDEQGHWQIEPVELFRCFNQNQSGTGNENRSQPPNENQLEPLKTSSVIALETELKTVLEERARERRQYDETISDLRRRLDIEGEERRKLTALLVHDNRGGEIMSTKPPKETAEHFRHRRHSQRDNTNLRTALIVLLALGAILLGVAVIPNVMSTL